MTEQVHELKEEIKRLTERLKVSNREKANLQMAVDLINGISGVEGLTKVVDHILQLLVSAIGGSNIAIYYEAEGKWHYTDVLGNNSRQDTIDDDLVKQSVEQKIFLKAKEAKESKLPLAGFPLIYETWVYPLSVHNLFFGAIRLQGMAFEHAHYRANIDPFIQYSALILYHEVSNVRRLKSAYTKVNKAREKLQETNQLLNSLIENSPQAIIAFDLNNNITLWSAPAVNMFGWETIKAVGNPFETIFSQQNQDIQNTFKDVLSGKRLLDIEIICFKKDGSTFDASLSISPISDFTGKIHGGMAIIADISWRKKMESQIQQAQKMESIGTLTGGIAHDFNNIMGIILGNTELALEDVPEWNPGHSNLEEIKKASLRAANIVRQLLSFTRITDQKLQPMEIGLVIKDALKFLRSTIPTTIDIEQNISVTDETILADPTQINQIMMNLCINASHAMESTGGKITINVENVTLDDNSAKDYPDLKSGKHIKVVVKDTGSGIDPKIIDRIFDPYFTTKGVGKGSGMGLAVVHGIVKSHGGSIKVDSTLGKGTKFSILFPLAQEKAAVEVETIQEIPRGKETILFVDDEISIVNMVQRMFERLGYKVQTATTPQDALSRFALNPDHFDLVITDMTMPQMTGVNLSEKLMDIRPDIPIIICTGYSALVDEEKAKELGLAAYVMKPINLSEIAQTIRKVLDKK